MSRPGRRSLTLYGVLAAAAVAAIVLGLNSVYGFLNGSSAAAGSQRTATVALGTVQSSVSASGNVGVATSASAGFTTSGTLTALKVGVGDKVRAGEVLATIDPTSARNALMQAQANLEQAESTLASAEAGPTTAEQLSNESSIDQAETQLTSAKQQLATDQQTLAAAKKQLAADTALACPAITSGSSAAGTGANGSGTGATGSSGTASSNTGTSGTGASGTGSSGTGSNGTGASGTGSSGTGSSGTGSSGTGSSSTGSSSTGSSSTGSDATGSGASGTGSSGTASGGAAANGGGSGSGASGQGSGQGSAGAQGAAQVSAGSPGAENLAAAVTPATTTADAASPPTVSTSAATAVSATGATFAGTVNPQGFDTYYHFEYGTTPSGDEQTQPVDAGSSTAQVQVSIPVTGLQPGTTYYFRLVASNQNGAQKGPDLTVTTAAAAAPVAVSGSASGATTSTATLSGTVNPESNDTTYYFAYGTTRSFGLATTTVDAGSGTSAAQVSALLTGLKPGTTYAYSLVATNTFGVARGVTGFFTTSTATSAATGAASDVSTRGATLNGTVNPQGANTTYYFEYGLSGALDHRTAAQSAGAGNGSVSVSATLTGLTPGKTYSFRIVATNLVGTSDGEKEKLTTAGAAKPAVTAGSASGIGMSTATLTGTVDPGADDTHYFFEYGPTSAYGSRTPRVDLGSGSSATQVSAVVNGLKPGTTYVFRLVAANGSGTADGAEETFATTSAPGKPAATTGSASDVLATSATLTGSVNASGSDTKYSFEYGTSVSADAKTVPADAGAAQGATEVTATIEGLKPDTSYLFKLVATNRYGTTVGATQVVTTAQRSCVTDSSTVSTDTQAVQQQEAAVKSAELGLHQTQATVASSTAPDSATIDQDEAAVAQDKATVAADQAALDETTLRAPASGTVTAVTGSIGETVGGSGSSVTDGGSSSSSSSGQAAGSGAASGSSSSSGSSSALVTIDSLDKLEVVSGFAEADATKLAVGQPATITFPALPNTEVAGKVTAVSSTSTVVSDVVTYNATITLVDPPAEVKEGMTASVSVVTQTRANVLELPSSAITTNGNASTVQLLQDGKTTVTPVTTGLVGASTTEIVRGLQKGDVVVEPTVNVTAATGAAGTGAGGLGGGGGIFGGGGGGGAIFRSAGG